MTYRVPNGSIFLAVGRAGEFYFSPPRGDEDETRAGLCHSEVRTVQYSVRHAVPCALQHGNELLEGLPPSKLHQLRNVLHRYDVGSHAVDQPAERR